MAYLRRERKSNEYEIKMFYPKSVCRCRFCKRKPTMVTFQDRNRKNKWFYLMCIRHRTNRTYIYKDSAAMGKAWEFNQKELKRDEEEN